MTDLDPNYVETLEIENEALRTRIAELEDIVGLKVEAPNCFPLTKQEAKLFGVLMKRELVTKEAALTALYGGMDEPEVKIIDVFLCKLRKKLRPFGIYVETMWGRGYYMTRETKEKIREMIADKTRKDA